MALTATVQSEAWPPRVRLDTDGATVTRVDETGATVTVRGDVDAGVIYDYEAPQGVALTYTADSGGSAVVALPDCGNWLVHLAHPELSRPLQVEGDSEVDMPARVSSVRTYSGRPFSVAAGRRGSVAAGMTLHSLTFDETHALLELLDDQSILFLSTHPGHDDEGPRYVRVLDVSKRRFMAACESPRRVLALPYLVQDRPSTVVADAYGWDLMPASWPSMAASWAGMP